MSKRRFLIFMSLVLTLVVLSWGVDPGWAQNNDKGNGKGNAPGQLKQQKREAARQNAAPQQKGVNVDFAGVSPATATLSPLATAAPLAAVMAPGTVPDYFGVANYANSPLPTITGGAITPGTGMQKFVNTLPGLTAAGINNLGTYIPLAVADTTTFPGSDFYRLGLKEYTHPFHTATGLTNVRGYFDMGNAVDSANHYLGPLILATRNRPVRILFSNGITKTLNIPVDTTYMGAGSVTTGDLATPSSIITGMASEMRATLHLHGGNTPWISDGTTHQWITPATDPTRASNTTGFAKGYSFENVPDMLSFVPNANTLTDGLGTFYWTNQQSGRLMFYHDHAYGITRLNVYGGEAAGYLLVDPVQENALLAATAPGTIVTNPVTGAILSADLAHVIPLVIQDKTFVPDIVNQLPAQDPTWDIAKWGGAGSLWFPHVYTPNQNPADISGANGFGRWDWGPWFFPPQSQTSLLLQAYPCTSIATPAAGWAFPPLMCPGVPDPTRPAPANSPSGVPEGFMDTPVINGTAYPTLTVAPAAYRFQVLNAANDRTLNLGLYVADPLAISITAGGSGYAPLPAAAPVVTITGCTGITAATANVDLNGAVTGVTVTGTPVCTAPVTVSIPAPTVVPPPPAVQAQAYAIASVNTEVKMVPAVQAAARPATLPNCATSLEPTMDGGGLVTALFDIAGNPLNGTGLPTGGTSLTACWPLYNSTYGFTAGPMGENGVVSWGNSDGRIGGVPDPTTAGPPIIQIGAEGGVLPKVAVIPSTPISYDYNKRSVTVLNVLNHGLYIGPAERADIIVDFTLFAGKTLILYNDAPAPVPGADPRLDYFTNDPDYSSTGGAPTTMAGYGPNIRTMMQIQVTGTNPNTTTFSLPALMAAVPNIFATTQDAVIVPEPAYPAANGSGPAKYMRIQDNTLTAFMGGPIGGLTLTSGGGGYTAVPTVTIAAPSPCPAGITCVQATATATLSPAAVGSVNPNAFGFGYTTAPAVSFSGGGGTGAAATAVLGNGGVRIITLNTQGSGYTSAPTVQITAPPVGGTQATATATIQTSGQRRVTAITVTNPGAGYLVPPTVTITGGGGSGATATAALGFRVTGYSLTNGGSGYTSAPTVTDAAPPATNCGPASLCTAATATSALAPRVVANVTLTNNGGNGYTSAPLVSFSPPQTTGSTATAVAFAPTMTLLDKTIQELFTLDYGRMNATLGVELPFTNFLTQTTIPYGYTDPPTEIFKDGETQLWKITHNGVDTHFIHFHLFTVQVVNRSGWDGAIKPPDSNELGFKDTVRMNPLEDIIVALRPFKQTLPWPVPNSSRLMDTTKPAGSTLPNEFTNVDPTNQPAAVTNTAINFGWEYVWHCHILGHEENDMMRAMILAVAPVVPNTPTAILSGSGNKQIITLTLNASATAGTAVPSGFTIQRATAAAGPWTTLGSVAAAVTGTSATAAFADNTVAAKTTYYYRAIANNLVGYTQTYAAPAVGYPNVSADSGPSATLTFATN